MPWSKNCVIPEISRTAERAADNPAEATLTTGATFQITSAKLYVPIVTLPINDNIKLLENIKQEFKTIVSWNKYWSEMIAKPKDNILDYMTGPTFSNINRLFVRSFKDGDDDSARSSFDEYYMPLVEFKYFKALIDNKPFFYQPLKNKQEAYEKLLEMSRNNGYTTGKLLDY